MKPLTATTATNTSQQAMTLADIDLVAEILKNQPPEPIGEWMRNQGRPPEKYHVVFPEKMRDEIQGPMFWPQYVLFSKALEQPVFILCKDAPFEFDKMMSIDWATYQ